MICLCDVVILLGFVYMVILHVSTNMRYLLMLVNLHFTSYLYVLFSFMVLFIKNVDFPLHVKQCSGRVCPLRVQLKRVRIPIALRGLLSSLQTNAGFCADYSTGELCL